jgi:hypothetical protein
LNASSAVSSSIASVEEYWASQTVAVKILQHVQEELVEQSVILYGGEEGQGFVIFGRDAVRQVVLLEVEQAACTKGIMTMELE